MKTVSKRLRSQCYQQIEEGQTISDRRKAFYAECAAHTSLQIEALCALAAVKTRAAAMGQTELLANAEIQIRERMSDAVDRLAPAMLDAMLLIKHCEGTNLHYLSEEDKEFIALVSAHKLVLYWTRRGPDPDLTLCVSFMRGFIRDAIRSDLIFGRVDRRKKTQGVAQT